LEHREFFSRKVVFSWNTSEQKILFRIMTEEEFYRFIMRMEREVYGDEKDE